MFTTRELEILKDLVGMEHDEVCDSFGDFDCGVASLEELNDLDRKIKHQLSSAWDASPK